MVSYFPLLLLPKKDIYRVLRQMNFYEQCGFSLCSKVTKSLIQSLFDLEKINVFISVAGVFQITFCLGIHTSVTMYFFTNEDQIIGNPKLTPPFFIEWEYAKGRENIRYQWEKSEIEVRYWIDHFMEVFNISKIDELQFESDLFDLKSIKTTLHGLKFGKLAMYHEDARHVGLGYCRQVLNEYLPTNQLEVWHNPFENDEKNYEDVRKLLLIQNFDVLYDLQSTFHITLNDLLLMNSCYITIFPSGLTGKELNGFIKHWISGSNPRLIDIIIHYDREVVLNENLLFNGIKYKSIPQGSKTERMYKKMYFDGSGYFHNEVVKGGYDIERDDGKEATIFFKDYFQMIVWHK